MSESDPPKTERPLVTFALFAYNQERYIREAVEGAFAQTYEPLEIILSDDCSTDRTFEIMQEMAAAYSGPHRIVLRQSPKNRGLLAHINDVAAKSTGEIIVVAAGDDVSLPKRCEILVKAFQIAPDIMAAFSQYETIEVVQSSSKTYTPFLEKVPLYDIILNGGGVSIGATYAYRRDCFFWPGVLPRDVESEDRVLPLRAAVLGKLYYINLPLVRYRQDREESVVERKRNRVLGYNHPAQWTIVRDTLVKACEDEIMTRVRSQHLLLVVQMRKFSLSFPILFLPMRAIRKLQRRPRYYLDVKTVIFNS